MSEEHAPLDRIEATYAIWGRHPGWYAAQDWVTFLGRHRRIRGAAVAALGLRPGDRVLEVACGSGRNLPYLVRAVGPTGQVVGLDYSPEMLEAARAQVRRRGWSNVSLVRADAAELPVSGPFDGVLSVLGMSAIPRHRQALARSHEVLRDDGRLSVCDARLFGGPLRFLDPLLRAVYGRWAAWNPDRDLPDDIRNVFGNLAVDRFNLGSFFVAVAVKHGRGIDADPP